MTLINLLLIFSLNILVSEASEMNSYLACTPEIGVVSNGEEVSQTSITRKALSLGLRLEVLNSCELEVENLEFKVILIENQKEPSIFVSIDNNNLHEVLGQVKTFPAQIFFEQIKFQADGNVYKAPVLAVNIIEQ